MIYGLGIDITEINRIHEIQAKNKNFAVKTLTDNEYEFYQRLSPKRKDEFLAGRFSIKESYSKALGTGIGKYVNFSDLEILNDQVGKPILTKHPYSKKLNAHISISHTDELVMTEVILEYKEEEISK